jgi:eukaryotic-like serine/threonine-protein kinase
MTNTRTTLPEKPGAQQPSSLAEEMRDEKAKARARVGTVIKKKWRLDSLLGVGGMASVFAATHRNGSRAALKVMHSEFARDANIRERFLREGYVANRVDCPGRVAILDDDVTDQEEPFLVMELLEGETAQQLWRRKERRVPVEEALWIAAEVLATLEVFHAHGIVHRDLKPANIFITRENEVKLLDFGVARMRGAPGEVTRAGTALGTPSFMAPEQARGVSDDIDGRADVFSVGATLYALMSGQRLHQARSDGESFILAATQPAPSLARIAPQLPIEAIRLVDKALAWAPRNRFQSAAAMRKEVMRVLEGLRTGAISKNPSVASLRRVTAEEGAASVREAASIPAEAAPDDPAVLRLVTIFRRLAALLPVAAQRGFLHASADVLLHDTFTAVVEALREAPGLVWWKIKPYAFAHRGQIVWEPGPPLDGVPYNLFAAGVRGVQLTPGLTEEELRDFCSVLVLDPPRDLSPEDDIASVLWEMRLEHVRCDTLDDFAEAEGADMQTFYQEADDLESIARESGGAGADQMEAAAMPIETDAAALHAARQAASVLALDPVAKKALGAQLAMTPDKWRERYIDVLAEALLQATRQGDAKIITDTLRGSMHDLLRARRFTLVFSTIESVFKAVEAASKDEAPAARRELASGVLTPDMLRLVVWEALGGPVVAGATSGLFVAGEAGGARASQPGTEKERSSGTPGSDAGSSTPGMSLPLGRGSFGPAPPGSLGAKSSEVQGGSTPPVDLDAIARSLEPVLAELGPTHIDAALDVIGCTLHEGIRRAMLGYLERALPGNEEMIAARLSTLDMDAVRLILRRIAAVKTDGGPLALKRLAASPDPNLRCEIAACLAKSLDALRDELAQMAEEGEPEMRVAALRALVGNEVQSAVPRLVKRAQDSAFHKLSAEERREVLAAIYSLDQERAEPVVIDIVQKHGLLVDEAVEETRAIAADLLGQRARSSDALQAVLGATKRRWWNTQPLRDVAGRAAEAIATRLGKRIGPNGEVQ